MLKKVFGIILAVALCVFLFIEYKNQKTYSITKELITAIRNNDIEMAKLAIARGANVNAMTDKCPTTLLVKAIRKGNPEMVALLLSNGADPLLKPYSHEAIPLAQSISYALGYHLMDGDPEQLKVQQNQKYIIPLLISANAGSYYLGTYSEVIPAILTGNIVLVKKLLEDNPDNIYANYLLRATVFSADKEMIKFILSKVPKNDEVKKEVSSLAIESGNQEIIDYASKLLA